MPTIDKDALMAIVREVCGEQRAEIMAESEKWMKSIEAKYGSAATARAQGVDTNFLAAQGGQGGVKAAPQFKAGRFLRSLAATRGDVAQAKSMADKAGDKVVSEMCARVLDNRSKAMAYSDFSAGGSLVPEEFSNEVIGLLYNALTVSSLGVDVVPMPNGNLTLPFLDTGSSASYVGEVQNITPSQPATGALQLTAKKLAAVVPISNDLLRTPSARADQFVQNDMISRLKVRADLAFLRGSGASGEPKGVRNWAVSGNTFAQSGTDLAAKVADLGRLVRHVQEQNVPLEKTGYIFAPRTEWALKNTLDSLGNFIFRQQMEAGTLMGHAYRSSNQMPITLGAGSDSEIVFGAFGHVIIGDTEQIEISAHPDGAYFDGAAVQSGVSQDVTPMRAIARHDLGCRYRGKEIAVQTGTTWS